MESTQIQALYEPPLAAMPQLREKPRQGFETWKTAWKPGPNVPNFTVALGLRAVVVENGVRGTYSARYYNPSTGRFMSRDPWKGFLFDAKTLHKYLYVGSNPVNYVDPRGRDLFEYSIMSNAAIPEARLVSIYGCVASASFTAASLILAQSAPNWTGYAGIGGAVVGCVTLLPVPTAAVEASPVLQMALTVANYGFCGVSIWGVVQDLNDLVEGKTNAATTLVDTLGSLVGCVGTHLGALIDSEGRIPPGFAD